MAIVNLTTFQDILGGTEPVDAVLTAMVYRGKTRAIRVAGDEVTFPEAIKLKLIAGVPETPLILLPLDADCHWKIEVTSKNDAPFRLNGILPLGDGPFEIEDLILVDPATSLPDPSKSLAQALIDQVNAAADRAEAAQAGAEAVQPAMVVGGHIEVDNLILETYGGDTVDAGYVRGPRGYGVEPGGTAGQVLVKASSDDYDTQWQSSSAAANQTVVINVSGQTINKGDLVYISGAMDGELGVDLAIADSDDTSSKLIGMASSTFTHGSTGYIINDDYVDMINTAGFVEGQAMWLSESAPGSYTPFKPAAPNKQIIVGYVRRVSATEGSVYVQVGKDLEYDLDSIANVDITNIQDGQIIIWDESTLSWVNRTPAFQGYTHNQPAALATWTITHNLNYYPNVNTVDSAGTTIEGELSYNSSNELLVMFSIPVSGVAYLS